MINDIDKKPIYAESNHQMYKVSLFDSSKKFLWEKNQFTNKLMWL